MKKAFKTTLSALALVAMTAVSASAATVHATSIKVGATTVMAPTNTTNRADLGNALGASNAYNAGNGVFGGFYSLGIGGSADFGFGTRFGAPGTVVEVTAGTRSQHVERVSVFAFNVLTSAWDALGSISNQGSNTLTLAIPLPLGAVYDKLRLTDTSPFVAGRDGFDIDSISVTAVPLPAGGLLLLGALGGLAALRRRKAA